MFKASIFRCGLDVSLHFHVYIASTHSYITTVRRLRHLHTVWWFLLSLNFLKPSSVITLTINLTLIGNIFFHTSKELTILCYSDVLNHCHLVHHSSTHWRKNSIHAEVSTGWNQLLATCAMLQKVHKLKFIDQLWVKNHFIFFLTSNVIWLRKYNQGVTLWTACVCNFDRSLC
jgi:hypothetical protein